jgi:hypothetical protein
LDRRAKHAECGPARSRNICFGHVPVSVRQGQCLDAVATGEERLGRWAAGKSKCIRLYLYNGKLILAATYLRRVFVVGRRFAAGAPALTHVCTAGASGTIPRREATPPPRLALPRAPPRAATEQLHRSPLPPRRRLPWTPRRRRSKFLSVFIVFSTEIRSGPRGGLHFEFTL